VRIEQYPTDSEVAATMLWMAHERGLIEDKHILDMGAGTGILGLGTMFFNPKKVTFIDIDKEALAILHKNLEIINKETKICQMEVINADIGTLYGSFDFIITNPPFGTKIKHADSIFLKKAFEISDRIYSLHKSETTLFLDNIASKNGFKMQRMTDFHFPIKQSMDFHRRKIHRINVSLYSFTKEKI
jgi:putative methylase